MTLAITSLRTKTTLALLLVALVPSLVFTIVWYRTTMEGQRRTVNGNLAAAASRGATAVEGVTSATLDAMRVQARLGAVIDATTSADPRARATAQATLTTLRSADPVNISAYALLRPDGRQIASTDAGGVFRDAAADTRLLEAAELHIPIATPIRITPGDSTYGRFRVAAAVHDPDGRMSGILAAELTTTIFEEILREQVRLVGSGAQSIIYDSYRVRLVSTNRDLPLFTSANPMADSLRERLVAQRRLRAETSVRNSTRRNVRALRTLPDSTYTYLVDQLRPDGTWETWMAASAPIRPFNGLVSVELPVRIALEPTQRALLRDAIGLTLLISIGIVLLAIFIGHQITRPLLELADAVRRFSAGERSSRVLVRSDDEAGQLAGAFNELGERIDSLVTGLNERTQQLEQDIAERERLESELVQTRKMEAVGKLAGGVAHDFNNLLTVILQNAELARALPDLPAEGRQSLEDIADAAERGAGLTRQLLAFARRGVSAPRVIDVADIVRTSERLLRNILGSHITLTLVLPDAPCCVLVDASQFEQVLMNVAGNARDAMQTGGTLRIEVREETPDDAFPTGSVVVSVSDTGMGMTSEVMARAFEPFFSTKEESRGTGLGLATVYGIVTQYDGTVGVESTPGAGTRFTFRFPAARNAADESDQAPRQGVARSAGKSGNTILLVEDEMGVRHTLARSLRRLGHTVHEAGDGLEGIALGRLHARTIDLLISDVVMPGANGFTVASTLAAEVPGLRVLLMSGYSTEARAQMRSDAPEFPLIEKPFSIAELTARVEAILSASV